MSYLSFKSEYDKAPRFPVESFSGRSYEGQDDIISALREHFRDSDIITAEMYPGVDEEEYTKLFENAFAPCLTIRSEEAFFGSEEMDRMMHPFLTDDRVRGKMYFGDVSCFMDPEKVRHIKDKIRDCQGKVLVTGFGASLLTDAREVIYCDISRWEIQLRYRSGMPNFNCHNGDEDILIKYKRGYFVEWRMADRLKRSLFERTVFYIDANRKNSPRMITGKALEEGLSSLTRRPFRLVPYFDPGVWGGQWMKEVCSLDPSEKNYAWSFDGVPEENSLLLQYGDVTLEIPAINLVLMYPRELLGEKNYSRFGAEFPIRFDLLDTMGGQNLSLQVHPTTDYIHEKFGMSYTQDESYYILDAEEDGGVYLGVRKDTDPRKLIAALERAQEGDVKFDAEEYINFFPARKHDHFLIPAGTIHCSSRNTMVLEISATPYIFTFKLWDWDRLGLDGKPRPIHIDDGKNVIRYDRDTDFVKKELIDHFEVLEENEEYKLTRTGLHSLEFIESQAVDIYKSYRLSTSGETVMANLVEGEKAVIESTDGSFSPYVIHYAETFIVPAGCRDVMIRPVTEGPIRIIKAQVRHP